MRRDRIEHCFVDAMPESLDEGVVYVSIPYAMAMHRCLCGCGHEVVTPFSRTDWALIYDGESVSLKPSIGNWSFPCQSHYFIEHDRARWAPRWTPEQIAAGRAHDRFAKGLGDAPVTDAHPATATEQPRSWWRRLASLLRR